MKTENYIMLIFVLWLFTTVVILGIMGAVEINKSDKTYLDNCKTLYQYDSKYHNCTYYFDDNMYSVEKGGIKYYFLAFQTTLQNDYNVK